MSTLIKQYEQSILQLENVRKNRIATDKRLNEIQKDCNKIKKDLYEMREYIKQYNLN